MVSVVSDWPSDQMRSKLWLYATPETASSGKENRNFLTRLWELATWVGGGGIKLLTNEQADSEHHGIYVEQDLKTF